MAVTDFSGLTITKPQTGLQFTKVTDTSADWASVAVNTYFYDKASGLVYFKNSLGGIVSAFMDSAFSPIDVGSADAAPTAATTQYYYQTVSEITKPYQGQKYGAFLDLIMF